MCDMNLFIIIDFVLKNIIDTFGSEKGFSLNSNGYYWFEWIRLNEFD